MREPGGWLWQHSRAVQAFEKTIIKVRWRSFDTAKLIFLQKWKAHKLAESQRLLGDTQLHFVIMRKVILDHRPELADRYERPEILIMRDKKI